MTDNTYELREITYYWNDEPDTLLGATIAVGEVSDELKDDPSFDDNVFFYVDNEAELQALTNTNNGEDFTIVLSGGA